MCLDCRVAGQFNSQGHYDKAEELHGYCKGECACQHKIGLGWYIKKGQRATPMQAQYP